MVAETQDELRTLIRKQRIEKDAGLDTELLTGRALRDYAPYLASDLTGAVYCGREGHANPLLAAPAFAARAIEAGAALPHARARAQRGDAGRAGAPAVPAPHRSRRGQRRPDRQRAGAWAPEVAALSGLRSRCTPTDCTSTSPSRGTDADADGPAHRPAADPEAGCQRHVHHRRRLASAAAAAPARYSVRWDSAAGNTAVAVRVMPALATSRSCICGPASSPSPTTCCRWSASTGGCPATTCAWRPPASRSGRSSPGCWPSSWPAAPGRACGRVRPRPDPGARPRLTEGASDGP